MENKDEMEIEELPIVEIDVEEEISEQASVESLNEEEIYPPIDPETGLYDFVSGDLALADLTIAALLSATNNLLLSYQHELSSVPIHPYEKLKYDYLTADVAPIKLDDIATPVEFCSRTAVSQITSIAASYEDTFYAQVASLTSDECESTCNMFASLSENIFVVDRPKMTGHLQFVELLQNVPLQLIETQPEIIAQKLIAQFINTY